MCKNNSDCGINHVLVDAINESNNIDSKEKIITITKLEKSSSENKCVDNKNNGERCSKNANYETNIITHENLCGNHIKRYIIGTTKEYFEKK